jgi:hypothetical protein
MPASLLPESVTSNTASCPLCAAANVDFYLRDKRRPYWQCGRCDLVFVPQEFHLDESQEKAEYDLHQNDPLDPGYRRFLGRLAGPLLERLPPASVGLDFGCGPGPGLHLLLQEAGHQVALYDKFYANNPEVLDRSFDFITATEVVEHLVRPGEVLDSLWHRLNAGGFLALMTKRVIDADAFAGWHYKNDPTHIAFFSDATMFWLASRWCAGCEFVDKDVAIFKKP